MRQITASGELQHLPTERIWVEMDKALGESNPEVFITVLRDCDALESLLPEVAALFGVPQNAEHHPEIDTGVHVLMSLQQVTRLSQDTSTRFAVLMHDLGKGTTPQQEWPRHIAHETRGIKLVRAVCKRLAVPNQHRDLALLVCEYHTHCHRAKELRGNTIMKLFTATDALRRPERFEQFLLACEADARGRSGLEDRPYPQADYLRHALTVARDITAADFADQGLEGKDLGQAIAQARVQAMEQLRERADQP
jgi:tRNA nucleotidyltransferase (CCA-adding enzyme)